MYYCGYQHVTLLCAITVVIMSLRDALTQDTHGKNILSTASVQKICVEFSSRIPFLKLLKLTDIRSLKYTVRHKKLHPSYWYNNFAKLCHTVIILAHRCTWEYPIACLFDSLCKIENWKPAYQICYCLLSSRQQRKMWNSCCNARQQTSLLQTYGLLTVLILILCITGCVEYYSNVFIWNLLKTQRWWTEVASDRSVVCHPAKYRWSAIEWRVHLNAWVKAKGKHFENMLYDVLFHNCQ